MGFTWEEAEVAVLTDTDGIVVWPNVWDKDKSKSRWRLIESVCVPVTTDNKPGKSKVDTAMSVQKIQVK